jgi:hypothetical protein
MIAHRVYFTSLISSRFSSYIVTYLFIQFFVEPMICGTIYVCVHCMFKKRWLQQNTSYFGADSGAALELRTIFFVMHVCGAARAARHRERKFQTF